MMAEQGSNDLPSASDETAQTFEPDAAETTALLARHARFKALFGQLHGEHGSRLQDA
jgi:hypothetical protein